MTTIGTIHLASATLALLSGGYVLFRAKGTAAHRRIGWVYAVAMLVVNVTALTLYRLTGYFGPFHVAAIASLVTLVAGVTAARRRGPHWVRRHYYRMSYSYLGLVAAAIAETATRVRGVQVAAGGPGPLFWSVVVAASIAVFVVGNRLIRSRAAASVGRLGSR